MINVLIADDEERVCRLIQALVDWESFDMQVIGVAHNGLEALQTAQDTRPDLLITDIRMPGCNGLELIEQLRKLCVDSEFIIISGYTHFEYAKMAIQYGVSDYLLKPINKQELGSTLERIRRKIETRVQQQSATDKMRREFLSVQRKVRACYLMDLLHHKNTELTLEMINHEYRYSFQEGIFRGFVIKMDYQSNHISGEEVAQISEQVRKLVIGRLREICYEAEIWFENGVGVGILNYSKDNQIRVQELLIHFLRELQVKHEMFPNVVFSMAMADETTEAKENEKTVQLAKQLIDERFVFGSQKVITNHMPHREVSILKYVEKYAGQFQSALALGDHGGAERVIEHLQMELAGVHELAGQDLIKIILLTGERITEKMREYGQHDAVLRSFQNQCMLCNTVEQLFACLKDLAKRELAWLNTVYVSEEKRPIQAAKSYIEKHYAENISLDQIAGMVGFNSSYFSALFKKECGIGLQDYVTATRMDKAKELIQKSDLPLAEICYRIGYKDIKHFTKTFKKNTGLTPGEYRRMYG